jgi:hypothetical protein
MDITKVYKTARGLIAAGLADDVIAIQLGDYVTELSRIN